MKLAESIEDAIEAGVPTERLAEMIAEALCSERERAAKMCADKAAQLREALSLPSGGTVEDTEQGRENLGHYLRGFADGHDECAEAIKGNGVADERQRCINVCKSRAEAHTKKVGDRVSGASWNLSIDYAMGLADAAGECADLINGRGDD